MAARAGRALALALIPALGAGGGAVLADTVTPVPGVDQLPILIAGGTTGLIAGLVILAGLFIRRVIEPASVGSEWQAIAATQTDTVNALVPSVDKLVGSVDRLLSAVELMNTEARLRREFEVEERRQQRGGRPRA